MSIKELFEFVERLEAAIVLDEIVHEPICSTASVAIEFIEAWNADKDGT